MPYLPSHIREREAHLPHAHESGKCLSRSSKVHDTLWGGGGGGGLYDSADMNYLT